MSSEKSVRRQVRLEDGGRDNTAAEGRLCSVGRSRHLVERTANYNSLTVTLPVCHGFILLSVTFAWFQLHPPTVRSAPTGKPSNAWWLYYMTQKRVQSFLESRRPPCHRSGEKKKKKPRKPLWQTQCDADIDYKWEHLTHCVMYRQFVYFDRSSSGPCSRLSSHILDC